VRIKTVSLSWFRGAAYLVSLEPECKSIVVYGVNGSGKSSFVDAVEYVLNDGRVGHLAHEYSGKHLQNALPNTHKPPDAKTQLSIKFRDGSEATVEIKSDGTAKATGSVTGWDYRRTVLRQDEVAAFIKDTKGAKYSALLPLLGLQRLEVAAENLRHLARNVESLSQLEKGKETLAQVTARRNETFGADSDAQILEKIATLHGTYCPDKESTKEALTRCNDLTSALDGRIARLSSDQKRHLTLRAAAEEKIKGHVEAVRAANAALAKEVDPLISQKLVVLQAADTLGSKLPTEGDVECPVCGQTVQADALRAHITAELERLQSIRETFNARNVAMRSLSDSVKNLKSNLAKSEVKAWRAELGSDKLAQEFGSLDALDAEALRSVCDECDLHKIEEKVLPIVDAAVTASANSPPEVQELLTDKRLVEVAKVAIPASGLASKLARDECLASSIRALEQSTREEIKARSKAVLDSISDDIKAMWSVLHPGEAIDNVHLYAPKDVDKAIDVGLKFHGKELASPRLTLSEGYRNSLGLCIFLAMAKREAATDRPVILDDVVVSLDRSHRGMIVELLRTEFAKRQVIILTHDRDWYTELRQQLDDGSWSFRALLPYDTPETGIRWSHKSTTFDDARAQLHDRPDSAGNDARKIMDVELAIIAERLQIKVPYLRFEKNDRRLAHDFLERLISDGQKCFQIVTGKDAVICLGAIEAFKRADKLLLSWGNKASHSFDLVRPEAAKLIDECEKALACFRCSNCGKPVWFADASGSEWTQCQCGSLRWRYGKA
jgi:hypothetical protein